MAHLAFQPATLCRPVIPATLLRKMTRAMPYGFVANSAKRPAGPWDGVDLAGMDIQAVVDIRMGNNYLAGWGKWRTLPRSI
jgi:hypothetical protein